MRWFWLLSLTLWLPLAAATCIGALGDLDRTAIRASLLSQMRKHNDGWIRQPTPAEVKRFWHDSWPLLRAHAESQGMSPSEYWSEKTTIIDLLAEELRFPAPGKVVRARQSEGHIQTLENLPLNTHIKEREWLLVTRVNWAYNALAAFTYVAMDQAGAPAGFDPRLTATPAQLRKLLAVTDALTLERADQLIRRIALARERQRSQAKAERRMEETAVITRAQPAPAALAEPSKPEPRTFEEILDAGGDFRPDHAYSIDIAQRPGISLTLSQEIAEEARGRHAHAVRKLLKSMKIGRAHV